MIVVGGARFSFRLSAPGVRVPGAGGPGVGR